MSLQRTFNWPHSKNPGETFEGWATESRQLSASLRQMLARRISASGGGSWLPTPTAGDAKNSRNATSSRQPGSKHHSGTTLCDFVWTTPTADDTGHRKDKYAQGGTALRCQAGGKLNPQWVEWLMGWPIGWTDCAPLATDRCQWPQRPLGTT
jgi:hypothetical protein